MRVATVLGIALLIAFCIAPDIAVTAILAEPELSIVPGHGQDVPLPEAPDEIVIRHPGAIPEVRVLDAAAGEVPGRVEPRGEGSSAFVPVTSPLLAGQYTVDFPGLGESFTFTVGPDVYGPRAVSVDPVDVARDTTVTVTFTEPLDPSTVSADTVRVHEVTDSGTREVPGTVSLDPAGTTIGFTPEGWPGFTPQGRFDIRIDGTVTDLTGNEVDQTTITLETDEETLEERLDLPCIPESIFWSSRRQIGVLDLTLRDRGIFESDDVVNVGDPAELVIDPRVDASGQGVIYGVDPEEERVVALETATGTLYQLRAAGARGIAIDPRGEGLYVTAQTSSQSFVMQFGLEGGYGHCGGYGCYVMPFRSDDRIRLAREKLRPSALAVSPDGSVVACLLSRSRAVALCFPEEHEPYAILPTDKKPQDIAFVARPGRGSVLLVSSRGKRTKDGKVQVFDGLTGKSIGELTGFRKPVRITVKGHRAWVAERGARRITAIDVPALGMPTRGPSFAAGPKPVDVAWSPDGSGRLFVVNGGKSRITVLSAVTGEFQEKIRAPGAIAVTAWGED